MSALRLALILALGLAMRLPSITRSLWLDEGYSIAAATNLQGFDAQRPLYFLLLRVWMALGNSEWWLRLPALFFGLATIAVIYLACRRALGERVATIAAVLLALSSPQSEHSAEVRMYTMAPLLLACSALAGALYSERRAALPLLVSGIFGLMALLTLPQCALGCLMIAVVLLYHLRRDRRAVLRVIAVNAAVLAAWSPFLVFGMQHQEGTAWLTEPPRLASALTLHGWALVGRDPYLGFPGAMGTVITRATSIAVLGLAAAGASTKRGRSLALGFYGVVVILFVASIALKPLWLPRYFMPFFPALFVLVALGLERIRGRLKNIYVAALTALILTLVVVRAAFFVRAPSEDWRSAAAYISAHAQDEPVEVVGARPLDSSGVGVWSYYYPRASVYLGESAMSKASWLVVRTNTPNGQPEQLRKQMSERGAILKEFGGVDVFECRVPLGDEARKCGSMLEGRSR